MIRVERKNWIIARHLDTLFYPDYYDLSVIFMIDFGQCLHATSYNRDALCEKHLVHT